MTLDGVTKRCDTPEAQSEAFGGIKSFLFTNHFATTQYVEHTGDSATAHTLAIAIVIKGDGAAHVRGIEYRDRLVLTDRGWRISHREHRPRWQFDVTTVPPALGGARWIEQPSEGSPGA